MHIRFIHTEFDALGVEYLSAVLKQAGHSTDLITDFQSTGLLLPAIKLFQCREKLIRKILKDKPDLIAFSVTSNNIEWAYILAGEIKKYSCVPIVFGGIQATLIPEAIIARDFVDFVIVGEGEIALVELVKALKEGKNFSLINNLCFKDNGKVQRNALGRPINNLDELPFPDKELFQKDILFGRYSIITGRGCVGICTYCCVPFIKKMYQGKGEFLRRRSPGNVIKELILAKKKYNIKKVMFEDDLFTYDKKWLNDFAGAYSKEISLPCVLCSHPNFLDEEIVSLLKKINCKVVEIGVQSLNEEIRSNVLKRYYTNESLRDALNLLKRNNISSIVDNIIGLPGETKEDILKMLRFYNEIRPGKIDIFYLKYYPGLEITKRSNLAPHVVEAINNGEVFSPPIVESDENLCNPRLVNKLLFAASLIYVLPRRIINLIFDKDLYYYLPYLKNCYRINEIVFYFALAFKRNLYGAFVPLRVDDLVKLKISIKQFFRQDV